MKHVRPVLSRRRQTGATMLVTLVLLVAMALLAVWSFNSSTTNMRAVGNAQARQEAQSAAQAAVEATISTKTFTTDPAGVGQSTVDVPVNGTTYTAQMSTPTCYRAKVIKNTELSTTDARDLTCLTGQSQQFIDGASNTAGDSQCANTEWNVSATVTDQTTKANVTVSEGVSVRADRYEVSGNCPKTS